MRMRDLINRNPAASAVTVVGLIVVAGWLMIVQTLASRTRATRHFYTVDDGVTSFIDRANREPPFDHDGREAVRVHYFTCDGGKTRFVGWLEQYTSAAKAALDTAPHDVNGNLKDLSILTNLGWDGKPIVRRPTDPRWFQRHEVEYEQITRPVAPEGADETQLIPVEVN